MLDVPTSEGRALTSSRQAAAATDTSMEVREYYYEFNRGFAPFSNRPRHDLGNSGLPDNIDSFSADPYYLVAR